MEGNPLLSLLPNSNGNGVGDCPESGHLESILGTEFLLDQVPLETENPSSPQKWEPKELRPRHREILRRILEGATNLQIAAAMGISPQTVMLVATSKLFKEELAKLEATLDVNVIKRADDLSNEALDQIKLLMRNGKSQQIQLKAAERILDTAGYSKIERKVIGVVRGEDVIKELLKRRREKQESNNQITVES